MFGTGKRFKPLVVRVANWWMRCLKEGIRVVRQDWSRIGKEFSQLKSKEEFLQLQQDIKLAFHDRWKFTVRHYMSAVCSSDCPCAEPKFQRTDRTIDPSSCFSQEQSHLSLSPNELLVKIFTFAFASDGTPSKLTFARCAQGKL
jgi:hypothetical protein